MKKFTKINLTIIAASMLAACGGSGGGSSNYSGNASTTTQLVTVGSMSAYSYNDSTLLRGPNNSNFNPAPSSRGSETSAVADYVAKNLTATITANENLSDRYYNGFTREAFLTKSYAPNYGVYVGIRAANTIMGRYVTPTQTVNASKYNSDGPTIANRYNLSGNQAIDGTGTYAAIVDGVVKADNPNFQTKPEEVKYYTTKHPKTTASATTRELIPGTGTITQTETYLGNSGNHGTYTALTISGKGGTVGSGLAPKAGLTYTQLYTGDNDIGAAIKAVYQNGVDKNKKVTVINNSYTIQTLSTVTANGTVVNTATETDKQNTTEMVNSIKTALSDIAKDSQAPLLVFATGNYHYRDYLKTYVDYSYYKDSLSKDTNASDTIGSTDPLTSAYASVEIKPTAPTQLNAAQQVNYYNVNLGKQLTSDAALTQLLKTSDAVADNFIAVSGYFLDVDGLQSAYQTVIKEHVLKGDINSVDAKKLEEEAKAKVTNKDTTLRDSAYISHPGAIQCGVVKYSCLVASYNYNYPYDASTPVPSKYSQDLASKNGYVTATGTSFAAPQVSAAALLVKQQFPWMTAKQLKETLLTTARDVGEAGVDPVFGWGVLDVTSAVNGPGAFVYGDFVANLGDSSTNYYFNNNIGGNGGLIVNASNRNPSLYLSGASTYTGDTIVNGGNLILQQRSVSQDASSISNRPSLKSNLYVNNNANLFAYNADLGKNVQVNGALIINNSSISGNLLTFPSATLVFDMNGHQTSTVAGQATLNGQLVVSNANSYIASSKSNTPTKATKLLSAGNLTVNFSKINTTNNALVATKVYTQNNNLILDVVANSASAGSSTLSSSVAATDNDANYISLGATNLDVILAAADAEALRGSNGSNYLSNNPDNSTDLSGYATLATATSNQDTIANNSSRQATSLTLATDSTSDSTATTTTATVTPTTASSDVATASSVSTTPSTATPNATSATAASTSSSRIEALGAATGTSTTSSTTQLATRLQNLTTPQQAMIALNQSGVSYATLNEVASRQGMLLQQEFVQQVQGQGALTDAQIEQLKANNIKRHDFFFIADGHNTSYANDTSKQQAKATGSGFLLGYGYKLPNSNVGIAITSNTGDLTQSYTGTTASETLATGSYRKYGITANAAYFLNNANKPVKKDELALPKFFVGMTAASDYTSLSNSRNNSSVNTNLKGSTSVTGVNGGLFVGSQFSLADQDKLTLSAGVNWSRRSFAGLTESTTAVNGLSNGGYNQLALTLAQQTTQATTAHVGVDYSIYLNFPKWLHSNAVRPVTFDLGLNYFKELNGDAYSLKVGDALVAPVAPTANLFQATARLNFLLDTNLNFYVGYKYNKASNYKNGNFNLGVNYSF